MIRGDKGGLNLARDIDNNRKSVSVILFAAVPVEKEMAMDKEIS